MSKEVNNIEMENDKLQFSSIIDCNLLANNIVADLKNEFKIYIHNILPKVVLLLIGEHASNDFLIEEYINAYETVGIHYDIKVFSNKITESEILQEINSLNYNKTVTGIILYTTKIFLTARIMQSIDPSKDAECIHPLNLGMLLYSQYPSIIPATARSVLAIISSCASSLSGKNTVVIGRSVTVGKAIGILLQHKNYTVTMCNSNTRNLSDITSRADIVVSAMGKPRFLTERYFHKSQVVVDVGVEIDENGLLCGDVDFENTKYKVGKITPVLPGVGKVSIACSIYNVLELIKMRPVVE